MGSIYYFLNASTLLRPRILDGLQQGVDVDAETDAVESDAHNSLSRICMAHAPTKT